MIKIAPSLLSANFCRLGQEVDAVLQAGADMIHLDIMDNHYVPNLTFGPMICAALAAEYHAFYDVHLMVKPVDELIKAFAQAGANCISFHPEASEHIDRSLQLIRDCGCQAGLAFNPATPISALKYTFEKIDHVLVMSVNPGFGGQKFIGATLEKIGEIAHLKKQTQGKFRLAVDGGINLETIAPAALAGADTFIAGSAIYGSDDYQQAIKALRAKVQQAKSS